MWKQEQVIVQNLAISTQEVRSVFTASFCCPHVAKNLIATFSKYFHSYPVSSTQFYFIHFFFFFIKSQKQSRHSRHSIKPLQYYNDKTTITQHSVGKDLVTVGRKNSFLIGRNLLAEPGSWWGSHLLNRLRVMELPIFIIGSESHHSGQYFYRVLFTLKI